MFEKFPEGFAKDLSKPDIAGFPGFRDLVSGLKGCGNHLVYNGFLAISTILL